MDEQDDDVGPADVPLSEEYEQLDREAGRARQAARWTLRAEVVLLVLAAAVASVPVDAGWPAVLAAAAFAGSLAVRAVNYRRQPNARWRSLRQDAERQKSREFQQFALNPDQPDRVPRYLWHRVQGQRQWYERRASEHERSSRRLGLALTALTGAAVVVAATQATGVFPSDFVGVASALLGALEAFRQSEQHQQTAATYRETAQQLAAVGDSADTLGPDLREDGEWGQVVAEAERVLTGEHQQWLIRRSV